MAFRDALQSKGIKVYLADMRNGDEIEEVLKEVQFCSVFVAFGTKFYAQETLTFGCTRHELRVAQALDKPIFLIKMLRPGDNFEDPVAEALFDNRLSCSWLPNGQEFLPPSHELVKDFKIFFDKRKQCSKFQNQQCDYANCCPNLHMNVDGRDLRTKCRACGRRFHKGIKGILNSAKLCKECATRPFCITNERSRPTLGAQSGRSPRPRNSSFKAPRYGAGGGKPSDAPAPSPRNDPL